MDDVKGLLVDVDGVLRIGATTIPGTPQALQELREHGFGLRFLTNTSVRSRASLWRDLRSLGLPVQLSELFTAPIAAAAFLRSRRIRRIFLLVKGDVDDDFSDFEIADDRVEAVVIGGAEEGFSYANVNRAFQLILDGAPLVAIHRNLAWRTEQGLQIDAGAYIAGLEAATGATAIVCGKPSPTFFQVALDDLGLAPADVLVVGDDLDSDIRGALDVGARSVLVCTGKFRPSDLERQDVKPDFVVESFADLPALLTDATR